MEKAIQDLVWLSERLSGIIAVKDELKDFSTLHNQKKEMENAISVYKTEVEELLKEKETFKRDIKSMEDGLAVYEASVFDEIKKKEAEAKAKAADIVREASEKASSIKEEAEKQLNALSSQIVETKQELQTVVAEAEANKAKLESYKHELAKLKEKL